MLKKGLILATALAAIIVLVGCGGSAGIRPGESYVMDEPAPAGAESARQIDLTFTADDISPAKITMKASEKVLFVIKDTDDKENHNFLNPPSGLKETLVHPGQTIRRLWTAPSKPGTYEPSCAIHPWIRMTFVVE